MSTTITDTRTDKAAILDALRLWVAQRPGLAYGNYGEPRSYRAEMRSIARDAEDFRALARYVTMSAIDGATLADSFRAFSGRLTWDGQSLSYCTGQYWPTEYRKAACAVLASAIWAYFRSGLTGDNQADRIRYSARNCFGRGLADRWFR